MRPNNQNKRSRGRNGGRKHSNPLSRNFESNGPDVKVRGNASHVAEKYVQLARDAQASGDSVMAENYFQHAEHYFRIVSAAQAQAPQRNDTQGQNDSAQGQNDSADDDGETNTGSGRAETRSSSDDRTNNEDNRTRADAETGNYASEASGGNEPDKSDTSKPPEKPRRPRRKRAAEASAGNPADAPQPELPAFLTGAGTADAAE